MNGIAREKVTILHCTTEYPAPMAEVNLRAMLTLSAAFGTAVGYSDHTEGIEASIAAVALGATIIEKHFTLDRFMPGPDHRASIDPGQFTAMVSAIRNIELALGNGLKVPTASEQKNKLIARKSIVAARRIGAGEVFDESNLDTKRPGTGLSPLLWDEVIGRVAKRNFDEDELIEL
jgi:sialic acid synthase SpsE